MTYYIFAWMKDAPNYIVKVDGLEETMRVCNLKGLLIEKFGLKNKFGELLPQNGIDVKLHNTYVNLIGMFTLENQKVVPFSECVVELPVYTNKRPGHSGRICVNLDEIKQKSEQNNPVYVSANTEQLIQDKTMNSVIANVFRRFIRGFDSGYTKV